MYEACILFSSGCESALADMNNIGQNFASRKSISIIHYSPPLPAAGVANFFVSPCKGKLGLVKGKLGLVKGKLGLVKGKLSPCKGKVGLVKGKVGSVKGKLSPC